MYTDADADAPHVREADDAARDRPSYLDVEALVERRRAARARGAVHPGYGFLSENAAFARACADAGLTFVGPPPEAMELMGDKLRAKEAAARRACRWSRASRAPARRASARSSGGYPLLVKAAAGGGGRGMRVVERAERLDAALAAARREAQAGFGDDRVFVERFLARPRHIEVQVIADAHGTVLHLGERECSLQRRHQKVVEEAPSPVVGPALRARLGDEAVALARAAGYVGAGTVEFIADAHDPRLYFLEINARLQVEHPVTELVTGLDLVELQLRVAAGEPLPSSRTTSCLHGHAIEARVTAEDAARGFLPSDRAPCWPTAGRPACASTTASSAGTEVGTALRLAARQGDRPRPATARRRWPARPRAGRPRRCSASRPRPASCARCSAATRSGPASWTPG